MNATIVDQWIDPPVIRFPKQGEHVSLPAGAPSLVAVSDADPGRISCISRCVQAPAMSSEVVEIVALEKKRGEGGVRLR